jgi:hypothetical protein
MFEPIHQDQAYHQFADARAWLGVPHGADTLSNAAFVVVGVAGLLLLAREWRARERFVAVQEMPAYWLLFSAIAATAFGSAYYHLAPDDARLVWDRLPMAVGFMSLVCAVIGERVSVPLGSWLLVPLVALGVLSVLYWAASGDLRPYLLTQFGSIAAVVIIASFCPSRYTHGHVIFLAIGLYVLAKFAETYDRQIFELTRHVLSGHTVKHLLAAAALWAIYRSVAQRIRRDAALTSAAYR